MLQVTPTHSKGSKETSQEHGQQPHTDPKLSQSPWEQQQKLACCKRSKPRESHKRKGWPRVCPARRQAVTWSLHFVEETPPGKHGLRPPLEAKGERLRTPLAPQHPSTTRCCFRFTPSALFLELSARMVALRACTCRL